MVSAADGLVISALSPDVEVNRLVQWGVLAGIWWCLLIDVAGNYAGQGGASWVPIIDGTAAVVAFVHGAMARALASS